MSNLTAAQVLSTLTFDEDGMLPMVEITPGDGNWGFGKVVDRTKVAPEVIELLARLSREADGCTDEYDYCRLCGRSTDHGGEHSDEQYLLWGAGLL